MINEEIQRAFFENGVQKYKVAEKLGMYDTSFSRKLRKELPEEEKKNILKIISELSNKKGEN